MFNTIVNPNLLECLEKLAIQFGVHTRRVPSPTIQNTGLGFADFGLFRIVDASKTKILRSGF